MKSVDIIAMIIFFGIGVILIPFLIMLFLVSQFPTKKHEPDREDIFW